MSMSVRAAKLSDSLSPLDVGDDHQLPAPSEDKSGGAEDGGCGSPSFFHHLSGIDIHAVATAQTARSTDGRAVSEHGGPEMRQKPKSPSRRRKLVH